MASSSITSSSFTPKSESPEIIDQSDLCNLNTHKAISVEGTCYWGINNGIEGRQANNRCKHPVVALIHVCEPMKGTKLKHDLKTKSIVDDLQADLVTAKKALKAYAFINWIERRCLTTEARELARPIFVNVNDSPEFKKMRKQHRKVFSGSTEAEYARFVEAYEGTVRDNEWTPGKIAKELDDRMIEKAKVRKLWEHQDSKIDYSYTFSGSCHHIYCQAVPIEELSAAVKIDLAGGSVIRGLEWAFNEPTARPDAVPEGGEGNC